MIVADYVYREIARYNKIPSMGIMQSHHGQI
jgi:hypothetical protein